MDFNLYEVLEKKGRILKAGDFNFLNQAVSYYACTLDDDELFSEIKQQYPNHKKDGVNRIIILDENQQLFTITKRYESEANFGARKELYQNENYILEFQEHLNTMTSLEEFIDNKQLIELTLKHCPYIRKHTRITRAKAAGYILMFFILFLYFGLMSIQKSFNQSTGLVLTPTLSNIRVILQVLWVTLMIILFFIPPKLDFSDPEKYPDKLVKIIISVFIVFLLVLSIQSLRRNFAVSSVSQTFIDKEVLEVEYLNGSKKKFMIEDSIWMRHAGEGFDS